MTDLFEDGGVQSCSKFKEENANSPETNVFYFLLYSEQTDTSETKL